MSDITKHEWGDNWNIWDTTYGKDCILIEFDEHASDFSLNKDDAIASAKHFYDRMTDKEQIDFFHTMNKSVDNSIKDGLREIHRRNQLLLDRNRAAMGG